MNHATPATRELHNPFSPQPAEGATVPRVSVIIPTYNGSAHLAEAVESVWAHTFRPAEDIVLDDGSAGDTAARAERLREAAPVPLSVLRLPGNSGGPARPINTGVQASTGEFIAVLDQDDLWQPDKIARQARTLRDHPHVAAAAPLCGR